MGMDTVRIPARYLGRDTGETWFHHLNFVRKFKDLTMKKLRRYENAYIEIYSAQFLNHSEENLNQIRGTLKVEKSTLFERQIGKDVVPHDIDEKGFVRLKGPIRTVDADRGVLLYPRVFRKDHPEDLFHPDSDVKFDEHGTVEGRPKISVNDRAGLFGKYLSEEQTLPFIRNKILCEKIKTSCGPLNLTYVAFYDGADCFLTLKLLKWNGEGSGANVYGQIKTSNTMFSDDSRAKSLVYDRKRDENERVQPGQYVEFQRPVSLLPMGHHLQVELNIMHENGDPESKIIIAQNTFSFRAKCAHEKGTSRRHRGISESRKISGKWGKLELRVYWLPHYNFMFASLCDNGSYKECS